MLILQSFTVFNFPAPSLNGWQAYDILIVLSTVVLFQELLEVNFDLNLKIV